jgi:hypothetical protein
LNRFVVSVGYSLGECFFVSFFFLLVLCTFCQSLLVVCLSAMS